MKIARYGWKPDLPDHRDFKFARRLGLAMLPSEVDKRPILPPCYDQQDAGSCTGNSTAAAIQFDEITQQNASVMVSRLFIYFGARRYEGMQGVDGGAYLRNCIKFVNETGVCSEDDWPYDTDRVNTPPPQDCYDNATEKAMIYERLDNRDLDALRGCLAQGLPFVFGFTVYDAFEGAAIRQSGVLMMPGPDESVVGGHAVLAVGYRDETKQFIVRNSWGPNWGQQGHFLMPYAYISNPDLADDFWCIQRVANVQQSTNPPLPSL